MRGAQKAQAVDLGFNRDNLQLLTVDLAAQDYDSTRGRELMRRLLDDIKTLPGVRAGSLAQFIPFDQQGGAAIFSDEQASSRPADALAVVSNTVGVDYFQVMQIPILGGRVFEDHDDESAPRVAVINEALAQRFWPGKDPIDRHMRLATGGTLRVIGVVKTGKYAFLTEQPRPYLYLAWRQNYASPAILHVRTAGTPAGLVAGLRSAVRSLDPDLPIYNVKTMQVHLQHGYVFSGIVLGGELSSLFGLLGLALASIGLYGVVAGAVNQRSHEIGIRTALGATRSSILSLVMRRGMVLVLAGITAGGASGVAAAQLLRRVLFSIDPTDWRVFLLVVIVLVMVAAIACLVPARRATKLDPVIVLRSE